eukprot:2498383-Lingulodinium_polyedra.AAC.1
MEVDAGAAEAVAGDGVTGASPRAPEPAAVAEPPVPMDDGQTDDVRRGLQAASLDGPTHAGFLARVAENIAEGLQHFPRKAGAGPGGGRFEHWAPVAREKEAREAVAS